MSWSKGYYTDSGYTYGFYHQLTPLSIYWAALIKGHVLPIDKFRYIDMGCGQGYNLIINAINHPDAEFVGLDLMPEHIQHATSLANKLGLENIKFIEFDFLQTDYDKLTIGKFDYVVAHGITTWVNDEVRNGLSKIADKALKIGGVFYNSYNTPYYWQQLMSFQHLTRTLAKYNTGQVAIDKAVELYEFINKLVPDFLDSNPHLREKLKTFPSAIKEYLIHEFCNQNWRLVFFDEEYEINTKNKLNYLGGMNLTEEYDQYYPKAFIDKISSENWMTQRILKDTFLSKAFKQDLWIKGRPQDSSDSIFNEINRLKIFPNFESPKYEPTEPIKIASGPIEIHTTNPIAHEIIAKSRTQGIKISELNATNKNRQDELIRFISILLDSKYISIANVDSSKTESNHIRKILDEIVKGKSYNFIPAGIIASAVALDTIGLIMLFASLEQSNKEKIVDLVLSTLKRRDNKVYSAGVEILGDQLRNYLSEFYDDKFLAIRKKLGVFGVI